MPKSKSKVDLKAKRDVNVNGAVIGHDQIIYNTPPDSTTYATRDEYLKQLIDRHQDLEFVGLPDPQDSHAPRIEEVFIHLQAEAEQELRELGEIGELSRRQGQRGEEAEFLQFPSKFSQFPQKLKRRLSANEALRENKLLVILGDPGAGKTTLLKYITLAFAQNQSNKLGLNEERLPIFVRLYDYIAKRPERSDKGFSLVDYLYVQARENVHPGLKREFFESELKAGKCCVCLDGLDELGGAGLRREVTAAVAALAKLYPGNRFIVTSRSVGYDEAPLDRREFIHHTVLPLSDDDIRAFVQKWYAAREQDPAAQHERAEHLTKTILAEPRIKSLAANPLMLTIIALVHRTEGDLPRKRVELYEKCVTAMVEKRDEEKGLKVEERQSERPHYTLRRRLLEQLAFWMHNQPGETRAIRRIKKGDLALQLTNFLLEDPDLKGHKEKARLEANAFISLAKSRIGLLVELGDGVYAFPHLTFQEYLAAAEIEHRYSEEVDQIWKFIRPRLHAPHWREVILLLLGSLNEFERLPTELVHLIYAGRDEYEDVLHRHLFLAARALANRVEVEITLRNAIVDRLLEIVRSSELAQDDALKVLASLQGNDHAEKGLLAIARNEKVYRWIQIAAAFALGQLGRTDSAIPLLLTITHDEREDTWIRSKAVSAIAQLGYASDTTLSGLLALAYDAKATVSLRSDAAFAFGQLGDADNAASILLTLACNEKADSSEQSDAIFALGRLGYTDDAILSGLLSIACDEKVAPMVQSDAALTLGQLGHTNEAIPILLAIARDEKIKEWVRRNAAEALGQLNRADEAASLLLALVRDEKVPVDLRYAAMHALSQLSHVDDTVLSGLLDFASNEKVYLGLRHDAARALNQLGRADDAASLLLAFALDETGAAWMRCNVARALGQLNRAGAIPILLAIAHNEKVTAGVRSDAALALGQLGCANDVTPLLLDIARNEKVSEWDRREAAFFLGRLGCTDEAALILLALIQDEKVDEELRPDAYESLKALVGGEAE